MINTVFQGSLVRPFTVVNLKAKRTCREEGCYGLVRGVSVLNMEEEGIFVKKKGVLYGLLEEVNVLNTEGHGLGRNVMKRGCSCRAQKGDDTTMVQVNSSWTLIPPSHQPSVIRSLRAVPENRVASPLLPHIHSHSDDLDRDLTAHHESPLDVDQGPPRAGTFPRLTDEKQPTYRVCKPLVVSDWANASQEPSNSYTSCNGFGGAEMFKPGKILLDVLKTRVKNSLTMRFKEKISNYGGMAIFTFPITTTPDVEKNRINWTRDPLTTPCALSGQAAVDIGTQEDMDITIKSEPDNYKSCFVKLEHLTDGFLKILENIKVDTNTKEDVVIPIKSEMDNLKPCCVKLERLSDTFIATGKHIKKNKGKLICLSLLGQVQGGGENIEYEGTKSLKKFIGEGCSKTALIGSKCIKQGGTRKTCKEEDCSRLARGGNVLNMEEPGSFVKKKGALNGLWGEVNVLDMVELRRNVMKMDALTRLKGEESVLDMEKPPAKKTFKEMGVLNGLWVEELKARNIQFPPESPVTMLRSLLSKNICKASDPNNKELSCSVSQPSHEDRDHGKLASVTIEEASRLPIPPVVSATSLQSSSTLSKTQIIEVVDLNVAEEGVVELILEKRVPFDEETFRSYYEASGRDQVRETSGLSTSPILSLPSVRTFSERLPFGKRVMRGFVVLIPLRNMRATTTVNALCRRVWALFWVPRVVVSDNGPCFRSSCFKNMCFGWEIKHITISPYLPGPNHVERCNRNIKTLMILHMRSNFGVPSIISKKAQRKVADAYNKGRLPVPFILGDKVLGKEFPLSSLADKRSAKLCQQWGGPWSVDTFLTPVTVYLKNIKDASMTSMNKRGPAEGVDHREERLENIVWCAVPLPKQFKAGGPSASKGVRQSIWCRWCMEPGRSILRA
uniref:Integrase catalytic domain-containing protein n=1 Tax=Timema shepardi TaxID=629360 RepID=A0A7R9AZR5_TIMSH|nr:unnamed protein product [Timema shepardi]